LSHVSSPRLPWQIRVTGPGARPDGACVSSRRPEQLPDASGLHSAETVGFSERWRAGTHDFFDRTKSSEQAARQGRAHAGKPLQHIEPSGRDPFRLAAESFQGRRHGTVDLGGDEAEQAERAT
jgi:hypothetical protein